MKKNKKYEYSLENIEFESDISEDKIDVDTDFTYDSCFEAKSGLTLGSLFDGIGGCPLVAIKSDVTPVLVSEIEKAPIDITEKHFPNMEYLEDITKLQGKDLAPVDILSVGTSFQYESYHGEPRKLFFEMVRIIKEMREHSEEQGNKGTEIKPRYLVWENVLGMLSSNEGEDFKIVLEEIISIGKKEYVSIPRPCGNKGKWTKAGIIVDTNFSLAFRQLNSEFFGLEQRRKRMFIVCDFAGGNAPEVLFECESL